MPTVQSFPAGGYRFISHQFQYSGGVAAEPGFRVERARFARPLPLAVGFDAIEAYLGGVGRSPTAFCACELRSPAQFRLLPSPAARPPSSLTDRIAYRPETKSGSHTTCMGLFLSSGCFG